MPDLRNPDVFAFSWDVPVAGCRWVRAKVWKQDKGLDGRERWVLTSGPGAGEATGLRWYLPLDEQPTLFRDFAQLTATDREAIRRFADKYGMLGLGQLMDVATQGGSGTSNRPYGEPHETWAKAITDMWHAVRIFDLIQSGDLVGLGRLIKWEPHRPGHGGRPPSAEGWYYRGRPDPRGRHAPRDPTDRPTWIKPVPGLFKPGDVYVPARFLLQRWVNSALRGAAPGLLYHAETGDQIIQIVPPNLITAMWLQLARAVSGKKRYRACRECGAWIEISAADDGRSARRMYCSEPCKTRDYRRRKARAAALAARGLGPQEVADRLRAAGLETDLETVRKWTSKKQRK